MWVIGRGFGDGDGGEEGGEREGVKGRKTWVLSDVL